MNRYLQLFASLAFAISSTSAFAQCPTDINEISIQGMKLVIRAAVTNTQTGVTDFSSSAGGATQSFMVGNEMLYLIQAVGAGQSVTGVVQCDPTSHELITLTVSWQSPTSYGTMGRPYPQPR